MAKYEFLIKGDLNIYELKKYSIIRKDTKKWSIFALNEADKDLIESFLTKKKILLQFIS